MGIFNNAGRLQHQCASSPYNGGQGSRWLRRQGYHHRDEQDHENHITILSIYYSDKWNQVSEEVLLELHNGLDLKSFPCHFDS